MPLNHILMPLISGKLSRSLYFNSSEDCNSDSISGANANQYGANPNQYGANANKTSAYAITTMSLEKIATKKPIPIEILCQFNLVKIFITCVFTMFIDTKNPYDVLYSSKIFSYRVPMPLHHSLMPLISGKLSRFLYVNSSEDSISDSKSGTNANQYGAYANINRVPMPVKSQISLHMCYYVSLIPIIFILSLYYYTLLKGSLVLYKHPHAAIWSLITYFFSSNLYFRHNLSTPPPRGKFIFYIYLYRNT